MLQRAEVAKDRQTLKWEYRREEFKRIECLEAENMKFRDALEQIAQFQHAPDAYIVANNALSKK